MTDKDKFPIVYVIKKESKDFSVEIKLSAINEKTLREVEHMVLR